MPKLTENQVTALHNRNKQNVSKLKPTETISFRQGGQVVLIGDGHDPTVVDGVDSSPVRKLGQIKLIRAAQGKDKGEVLVSGVGGQAEFKTEFNLIMKDAVMKFVQWQGAQPS